MNIKDNRKLRNFCLAILLLFALLGILAPFLANERSILVIDHENHLHWFPKSTPDSAIFQMNALLPYSPQNIDFKAMGATGPFDQEEGSEHWLGTDLIGRDILSAIVWGAQTSLLIGLISIIIAGFIGVFVGGVAGYFGNSGFRISTIRFILISATSIFFIFYFIHLLKVNWLLNPKIFQFLLISALQFVVLFLMLFLFDLFLRKIERKFAWKKSAFPIDDYLSRAIEIVSTLPILFIIITLSAILRPSIWNVIFIIGLTGWTGIARFTRSEFLSLKSMNFVLSAKSLGIPNRNILFGHILPNAYVTIFTALSFAFAGAILAETTLSFLGVGLPPEKVSWGSVLSMARQHPEAWWLVFFPSLAIFLVIFALQYLARYYSKTEH